MLRVLLIADDLTGALDSGVKLLSHSPDVRVQRWPARDVSLGSLPTVQVIDTASRHIPPVEAASRVAGAIDRFMAALLPGDAPLIYKKTDSTLRGNIGAELGAAIAALPGRALIFSPAYPALRRQVRNCSLLIDEVPIAGTGFGRDALNPVTASDLRTVISAQHAGPVAYAAHARDIPALAVPGTIVVVDAESEDDLRAIAECARELSAKTGILPILAGSAGLAAYLGMAGDSVPAVAVNIALRHTAELTPQIVSPLLFVNGSRSDTSRSQVSAAAAAGISIVELPAPLPGVLPRSRLADTVRAVIDPLRTSARNACVLDSPAEACDAAAVAAAFGTVVHEVTNVLEIGTLVVSGGDTLAAILDELRISSIQPLGEQWPGIVTSTIAGLGNPRYLLSKAGGFGEMDLLVTISSSAGKPENEKEHG